jgi:hypothetical protein
VGVGVELGEHGVHRLLVVAPSQGSLVRFPFVEGRCLFANHARHDVGHPVEAIGDVGGVLQWRPHRRLGSTAQQCLVALDTVELLGEAPGERPRCDHGVGGGDGVVVDPALGTDVRLAHPSSVFFTLSTRCEGNGS